MERDNEGHKSKQEKVSRSKKKGEERKAMEEINKLAENASNALIRKLAKANTHASFKKK